MMIIELKMIHQIRAPVAMFQHPHRLWMDETICNIPLKSEQIDHLIRIVYTWKSVGLVVKRTENLRRVSTAFANHTVVCANDGKRMNSVICWAMVHSAQTRLEWLKLLNIERQMERSCYAFSVLVITHLHTHTHIHTDFGLTSTNAIVITVTVVSPVRTAFCSN